MKKIGFITCEEHEQLYYDDQYLKPLFAKSGIEILPVVWDNQMNYDQLDVLVFRSEWTVLFTKGISN